MARPKRQSLEEWIKQTLTDTAKGKCTALALVHMVGEQQQEIHVVKFAAGQTYSDETLADTFEMRAEYHSQDLPGIQRFHLYAFYDDRKEHESFRVIFVNKNNMEDGFSSEGPDDKGQISQMSRRTEMIFQQVYRRQETLDNYSNKIIAAQGHQITQLLTENRDAFNIVKEMMMAQVQESHEQKMKEMQYERSTAERKKLMSMAAPLVNTITGREIFPQSTADTALIETLASTLSSEQIGKLAAVLPSEVVGLIAARFESALKEKREKEEALEAGKKATLALVRNRDPEDDAAGGE